MNVTSIRTYLLAAGLLLSFSASQSIAASNSIDKIDAAVEAGQLSADLGVIYRALAAKNSSELPAEFRSDEMVLDKCATDLFTGALALIEANPEQYGSFSKALATRPTPEFYIDTPSGHFRLHFDTSGVDAVPTIDADTNGVPDFIDVAMMAADSSWNHLISTLGYYQPVSDLTLGGGVDLYDIYFEVIPFYGLTTPETPGPAEWNDYSSFAVVHSQFSPGFPPNDDPNGDVFGALKVTIAHELHHAIQFAYNVFTESYFMEQTSTCMEEFVFPQVNDNHNYLPFFYDEPEKGLQADGVHRYASFIWPKFIEENFGVDVLRDMWASCRYNSPISAWSTNLTMQGSSLDKAFTEFALWNYFTDTRADTAHFEEGGGYPWPSILAYHQTIPDSGNSSALPPEPLGSNYIVFENLAGYEGTLSFEIIGLNAATWGLSYIIDYGNGEYDEYAVSPLLDGTVRVSVAPIEDVLRVIYIPTIGSHFGAQFNYLYHFSYRKMGDLDNNDQISISDAVFAINYIFGGGEAPYPINVMDVDCNGQQSISDAVYIVNYIFAGGPPPCVPTAK